MDFPDSDQLRLDRLDIFGTLMYFHAVTLLIYLYVLQLLRVVGGARFFSYLGISNVVDVLPEILHLVSELIELVCAGVLLPSPFRRVRVYLAPGVLGRYLNGVSIRGTSGWVVRRVDCCGRPVYDRRTICGNAHVSLAGQVVVYLVS